MSSEDELAIAKQFYTFANTPTLRPVLLSDATTTASLMAGLKSQRPEVIKVTLDTFFLLAADAAISPQAAKLDGLLPTLANLTEYDIECDEQSAIQRLAQQNLTTFGKAGRRQSANPQPVITQQGKAFGSKYNHQVSYGFTQLQTDDDKASIERILIHLKGTIAVTVDLSHKTANCFTSLDITTYNNAVLDALADYGPSIVDNTSKQSKRPGHGDGAALVSYKNKNKSKQQEQAGSGWLGGITSYFW